MSGFELSSVFKIADNGARVEVATFTHEGRSFAALGSVLDEDSGVIVGYPNDAGTMLMTWDGRPLFPIRQTGKMRGFYRSTILCWGGTYNGRYYSGRNAGSGMLLTLRCCRTKVTP